MKCPACNNQLKARTIEGIELDVCEQNCGGIWFDADEILKFDEPHEALDSALLDVNRSGRKKVDHNSSRTCPKCSNEPLVRQFFDTQNQVEIDQCWSCAGIWLDTGELITVRNQYPTYEERIKAVNAYCDLILDGHHKALKDATKQHLKEHEEKYSTRLKALISGFKDLLGAN